MDQHVDAGNIDEGLAGRGQRLVVFAQAAIAAQPGEGALHHPAMRQHLKAMFLAPAHDFQDPATQVSGPLDQDSGIAAIGLDQLQAREAAQQLGQDQLGAVSILNIGGVHDYRQQQAQPVHYQVALARGHFLAGVVAARPPFSVVLTVWLSIIAALGVGARPAFSRTCSRRIPRRRSHTPVRRQRCR